MVHSGTFVYSSLKNDTRLIYANCDQNKVLILVTNYFKTKKIQVSYHRQDKA